MESRSPIGHMILIAFMSMVVMSALSMYLVWRSEQKWCDLITTLDEGYNAPVQPGQPELTERGRRIALKMHQLRNSLWGCN